VKLQTPQLDKKTSTMYKIMRVNLDRKATINI